MKCSNNSNLIKCVCLCHCLREISHSSYCLLTKMLTCWFHILNGLADWVSALCWHCARPLSLPYSGLLYNGGAVSVIFPDTGTVRMELTKALLELRSVGFYQVCQLFTLLCLVAISYKVTILLAKRRKMMSTLEVFPGPPGHWLFGHILEVKYK